VTVDFNIKCFLTGSFTPGFGQAQGWKQPYELAALNLGSANDTTPQPYQYIYDQDFDSGLRMPIDSIEIVKTLDQGSWAHVEYTTASDRDVFEVSDNEVLSGATHIGHMMPRMKFPYRAWEIDLKAKSDSSWHTPALFRGMLTEASIQVLSDLAIAGQQDGKWKVRLDFESFDSFCLHKDINAALWYHRANATTDGYNWAFFAMHNITYAQMIAKVILWMQQGKPTTDFPITYSFASGSAPYNAAPYTNNIFDPVSVALTSSDIGAQTITMTNGSTAVTGTNTRFTTNLEPGDMIRPISNSGTTYTNWGFVSSITSDTALVLSANYAGTTRTNETGYRNGNTNVVVDCKDRPTWDILRDILIHMGATEHLGLKYIPQCSPTGAITVVQGGYDKTAAVDEDFRSTQGMQKNTSTDLTINFNLIRVPFTIANDAEYWIKFTLYKSDGAGGWITVKTIPDQTADTNYEYVPYDANNTHTAKYYKVPTQEFTPENTYKWDADLVTGGAVAIAATGGLAYSPATYNFLTSPVKIDYSKLRTFVVTQGRCSQFEVYSNGATTTANPLGCWDGGNVADGAYGRCPDRQGCYPDPLAAEPTEAVNAKYGIIGLATNYAGMSSTNSQETNCRWNSKRIYDCHQNRDSSIREPLECVIAFKDGWTTDLVGKYLELYSPELDEMVVVRCTEQSHYLQGNRVSTTMRGFRV